MKSKFDSSIAFISDDVEILTPMPDTSSLHDELYPTNGSTGSDHQSSAQKAKQQKLIDKAAEKARKKEAKRAEKQKKKLERKLQKQRMKEQQKAASTGSTFSLILLQRILYKAGTAKVMDRQLPIFSFLVVPCL